MPKPLLHLIFFLVSSIHNKQNDSKKRKNQFPNLVNLIFHSFIFFIFIYFFKKKKKSNQFKFKPVLDDRQRIIELENTVKNLRETIRNQEIEIKELKEKLEKK